MSLPELVAWRIELLRASLFFDQPIVAQEREYWREVTDKDPEVTINKHQQGEFVQSGSYLGGQCELKIAFNRVDLIVSYPFAGLPGAPEPGEPHALLNEWLEAVLRLLSAVSAGVHRLALGAVGFIPVGDIEQGNKLISEYFPFVCLEKVDGLIDLTISANSPCASEVVSGLTINRILNLSALERQVINLAPVGVPSMDADKVIRAELDVNSSQDVKRFNSPDEARSVATELSDQVRALLVKGLAP
jgi:hypothetical protein